MKPTRPSAQPSTSRGLRLFAAVLSTALVGSTLAVTSPLIQPEEAHATMTDGPTGFTDRPGIANDPVVVFHEDFENIDKTGPIVPLVNYTSVDGYTYLAEAQWADPYVACNGFVTSSQNVMGTACSGSPGAQGGLLALVDVLGQVNGTSATTNSAVSAYTAGPAYPANMVMFSTDGETIPLPTPDRFMTFSVNASATSCWAAQPSYSFSVLADGVETPIDGATGINPCTDPRAQIVAPTTVPGSTSFYGGEFAASGSFLSDGSPVGIVMRNGSGATAGNDAAFDDIQLLDVTPHLNKEFTPERVPFGGTTTLTFTVTNTSELAAKDGWSFTDTFRAGLEIASDPNVGGTCSADISAPAGGNAISATNGLLANGETDCTISVDVVAPALTSATATPQVFINNADDLSNVVGLDVTNETPVEFFSEPLLSLTKDSSAGAQSVMGDVVEYTVTAENVGTGDFNAGQTDAALQAAVITDDMSDALDDSVLDMGSLSATVDGVAVAAPSFNATTNELTWAGPLAVGEVVELSYSVTLERGNSTDSNRAVNNTACIPAEVAAGDACATTETLLPTLEIQKDGTLTPGVNGSADVSYTVTVTNSGPGDWAEANPATVTDDISGVIDEADLDPASVVATIDGVAVATPALNVDNATINWSGALASGQVLVLSYNATYLGGVDSLLTNTACVADDAPYLDVDNCATVDLPGPGLVIDKMASVDSAPIQAGSVVEYTLEFASTGQTAVDVSYADYLDGVRDDAEVTTEPAAGNGDLVAVRNGAVITITGSVPAGETYTIVYAVTVNQDGERGDSQLLNLLIPSDREVPAEGSIECDATRYSDGVEAKTCNPVVIVPEPEIPVEPTDEPQTPETPGKLAWTGSGGFGIGSWLAVFLMLGAGSLMVFTSARSSNKREEVTHG